MHRLNFLLVLLFFGIFGAQDIKISGGFHLKPEKIKTQILDKSSYNIYYLLDFAKNPEKPNSKTTAHCILQIGESYSRFSDFNTIKNDSLSKTLMDKASVGNSEIKELLKYRTKWHNVVVKQLGAHRGKTIFQDKAGAKYQYEEPAVILDWKLQNGEKEILGYQCQKATTKYRGRTYTAWFTKDLPINNGPYIFDGLPGLILEIGSNDGDFRFSAIAMDKQPREIYIRNEKEILTISREKFMQVKRNYHENPSFYFQGTVYNTDGSELKLKSIPYNPLELD